ncbi:MAG: LysR family transcriptional regulator [Terriglobales bacterium]
MGMGLRQLEAFRAVADTGSFTRACQTLYVTQSTVSQHIRNLENQLNLQLFRRDRRGAALTPAGEQLLTRCRKVFELLSQTEADLRRALNPYSGRLAFGCASSTLLYQLPPMLAEYARRYPEVELGIISGSIADVTQQLSAGALDLALVVLPCRGAKIRRALLCEEPFVLILPRKHPLAGGSRIAIKKLATERFILQLPGQNTRKLVDHFLLKHRIVPRIAIEIADTETTKRMVANGLGPAVLPLSAFAGGRAPRGVKVYPIPASQLRRTLAVVYPKSKPLRPAAEALVQMLQARFQSLLPVDRVRRRTLE